MLVLLLAGVAEGEWWHLFSAALTQNQEKGIPILSPTEKVIPEHRAVLLKLSRAYKSPGDLARRQVLNQLV